MMNVHWFDVILVGIIVLSVLISFFRGFLREIVSLAAWTLGIVFALKYADALASTMQNVIASEAFRYLISFLGIFLVFFILGVIINAVVRLFVDKTGISVTDRALGLFFGAARGFMAVIVLLMFMQVSPMANQAWYQESQLVPQFKPAVDWLDGYLPSGMKQMQSWVHPASQ